MKLRWRGVARSANWNPAIVLASNRFPMSREVMAAWALDFLLSDNGEFT